MSEYITVIPNPTLFVLKLLTCLCKEKSVDTMEKFELLEIIQKYQSIFKIEYFHIVKEDEVYKSEGYDKVINVLEEIGAVSVHNSIITIQLNDCGKMFADSFIIDDAEIKMVLSSLS